MLKIQLDGTEFPFTRKGVYVQQSNKAIHPANSEQGIKMEWNMLYIFLFLQFSLHLQVLAPLHFY